MRYKTNKNKGLFIKMYFVFQKNIKFVNKFLKIMGQVISQFKYLKTKSLDLFSGIYFQPQAKMLCIRFICLFFFIGLLAFSFHFHSSSINVGKLESKDYWNGTKLNFSTLHSVINKETCYAQLHNFLGCMQALSSLVTIVSDKNVDLIFADDQIKKGINFLSDIKISSSPKKDFQDVSEVLQDFKTSMTNRIQAWKALYYQTQKNQIRFYYILKEILLEVIIHSESSSRSLLSHNLLTEMSKRFQHKQLIAQSINSYLSITQSPHDHLIPLDLMKDRSKNQ